MTLFCFHHWFSDFDIELLLSRNDVSVIQLDEWDFEKERASIENMINPNISVDPQSIIFIMMRECDVNGCAYDIGLICND